MMTLKPRFMAAHYLGSPKLPGKVALITGGDSGIGRAVAVLFAREGSNVAIVYLNEHDDARATKACVKREGGRCLLIPGDVRQPGFCKRAVARTVETLGALDILVNNAAFQEHAKNLKELSIPRRSCMLWPYHRNCVADYGQHWRLVRPNEDRDI